MIAHLLILALVTLPPEAARHSELAVQHYDAGRLDAAIAEFEAAYAALPDARADREGREEIVGSLHGLWMQAHEATRAVAPLCDLRDLLTAHVAALRAAYPAEPEREELRVNTARLARIDERLAGLPANACEVERPGAGAVVSSTERPVDASAGPQAQDGPRVAAPEGPRDAVPSRQLRIAGGVTLGLGAAALGAMIGGIVREGLIDGPLDEPEQAASRRPLTGQERDELEDMRRTAQGGRTLAIAGGAAAAVLLGLGVGLLVGARKAARRERGAAAPGGSPAGVGMVMTVRLGSRGRTER